MLRLCWAEPVGARSAWAPTALQRGGALRVPARLRAAEERELEASAGGRAFFLLFFHLFFLNSLS